MPLDPLSVLSRPGSLVLPSNRALLPDPAAKGARAVRLPSGHLVFYGPHGRRILATDPDGNPLHECEWTAPEAGRTALVAARIRLDWGQWVGLKPGGMVRSTTLNLSARPGWQQLTADDLRHMAAQAMRVPVEEVRFFYPDQDLLIDPAGQATVRHRKDAFYVLEDGGLEQARFMACMGAMHWDRIDFLPVVELFQSLLPGTGSAAFELIRGLYDDAHPDRPRPLAYRGIPTYPSPAAYRLFSAFFTPSVAGGGEPFPVFMDPGRSHEVAWLPAPHPPLRYFDAERGLCVTVKAGAVQKVTRADDPVAAPFVRASKEGFAPCGRQVAVSGGQLELWDGGACDRVPAKPAWGILHESKPAPALSSLAEWRAVLDARLRPASARDAYSAVLLYPEGDGEIDELASQPFPADYLQDAFEQEPGLAAQVGRAGRVLIDHFDGALSSCVPLDRPREVTILCRHPAYAQKYAQTLWTTLAQANRLEWAKDIRLLPRSAELAQALRDRYELILSWLPFSSYEQPAELAGSARALAESLAPGGLLGLVGPADLATVLRNAGLHLLQAVPVQDLPTFRMHLSLLPQSRLKAGLTLFLATR